MPTLDSPLPEFGIKRQNEERRDGGCAIVFDPKTQKYAVGKHWEGGFLRLFSGGVNETEEMTEGIKREVIEESGLHNFQYVEVIGSALAHYHNTLRNVNRVAKATCLLIILQSTDTLPIDHEEHEKFDLHWATAEEIRVNWDAHNSEQELDHWFYFLDRAIMRAHELGYIQ